MTKSLAISAQHYLFSVQAFAQMVLRLGGSEYIYAYLDRTTQGVMDDVACGCSELGVIFEASNAAKELEMVLDMAELEFVKLAESSPRVALPLAHPLSSRESVTLEELAEYPYLYFNQGVGTPLAFAEEAHAEYPRSKRIVCSDRASLSELCVALNGYTITSGILVGVTDGSLLTTIPLESDRKLYLGYLKREGEELSEAGKVFVECLQDALKDYAQ